jgi:hypothetical protein
MPGSTLEPREALGSLRCMTPFATLLNVYQRRVVLGLICHSNLEKTAARSVYHDPLHML